MGALVLSWKGLETRLIHIRKGTRAQCFSTKLLPEIWGDDFLHFGSNAESALHQKCQDQWTQNYYQHDDEENSIQKTKEFINLVA